MTTTTTTTYDRSTAAPSRRQLARRLVAGAAPFDGVMGVACLAAAAPIGGWLSVGATTLRATGALFLVAAAAGVVTLRRRRFDVSTVVAANALFAAWCVAALAVDGPNALGAAFLATGAVASAATAAAEHRLGAGR